jgi:hypothetical protein
MLRNRQKTESKGLGGTNTADYGISESIGIGDAQQATATYRIVRHFVPLAVIVGLTTHKLPFRCNSHMWNLPDLAIRHLSLLEWDLESTGTAIFPVLTLAHKPGDLIFLAKDWFPFTSMSLITCPWYGEIPGRISPKSERQKATGTQALIRGRHIFAGRVALTATWQQIAVVPVKVRPIGFDGGLDIDDHATTAVVNVRPEEHIEFLASLFLALDRIPVESVHEGAVHLIGMGQLTTDLSAAWIEHEPGKVQWTVLVSHDRVPSGVKRVVILRGLKLRSPKHRGQSCWVRSPSGDSNTTRAFFSPERR